MSGAKSVTRRAALTALGGAAVLLGTLPGSGRLEAARAFEPCDGHAPPLGTPSAPEARKRGRFEALPDVSLSTKVEEKLNAVAERFRKKVGRTFVVTSGTRDPDTQADLIYVKLRAGEDLLRLYKDRVAVLELKRIYDAGRDEKRSRSNIVAQLASAIRSQIKRGVFISAHLRSGAADVRSTNMNEAEKRAFSEIARDTGLSVMLESTPPHFHLQLDL
jgi:hypothetical protein